MAEFVPSRISIDPEILQLFEAISRKQGELSSIRGSVRQGLEVESSAAIDAVHFSTRIEGNPLSRDQVTEALRSPRKHKKAGRDLQEVLNYAKARQSVREWALKGKPFTEEWVLKHHADVLNGIVRGKLRGHYRQDQCVIQDSRTRSIVYMAPEWKDVPGLMAGLLLWLRQQKREGASPLLMAAQFHFELVTIHPFMDGNGRVARLLTHGILMAGGYDVERFAALEKQHEQDRAGYYRSLRERQAGNFYDIPPGQDIRSWVAYWLKCLLRTYDEALSRVSALSHPASLSELEAFDDRLKKAESLFRRHRKLRASEYADLLVLGRTQAVADLNALVKTGLIERVGGGRSTVYRIREK